MLTNQNTTQENSKKCLKKNKRISKYFAVLTIVIILVSITCINASAVVLQDITGINGIYPSLIMYLPYDNSSTGNTKTLVEVSGAGKEVLNNNVNTQIYTNGGWISYTSEEQYYEDIANDRITTVYLGSYSTQNPFTNLYTNNRLNINLWEWSQEYDDNIIWKLWDYSLISRLEATYVIELPYFNNSALLGTQPLEIRIEEVLQANSIEGYAFTYDIEIPDIDKIIEETIATIEGESQSGITFQYKGEQLSENNYVTNVYAEDGSKVSIDFKKALSTVLVNIRMSFNEHASTPGIRQIGIINYNDYSVNDSITSIRTNDFRKLVIEDEFERTAEITMERQEKDVRLLNWLGNAIAGIMNIEIFPNFSIGGLLSVIVMIPLILWILKLVAGG